MAGYGTAQIIDTARYGQKKVYEYGIERMQNEFEKYLAVHNKNMEDIKSRFVQKTSTEKRFHIEGEVDTVVMTPVERQYGVVAPQMIEKDGYDIGIRLDAHQAAQAWELWYLVQETVDRMNDQLNAILAADKRFLIKRMLVALFDNTSYTVTERYNDGEVLPIYPLLNGDTNPIPRGQYDQEFDPTTQIHHHVVAAINDASVAAGVLDLTEHMTSGKVIVEIAYADRAAWRALTGFYGPHDLRIEHSMFANSGKNLADKTGLDLINPYDSFLGIIEGLNIEIYVRPYVPTNYTIMYAVGGNLERALRGRSSELTQWESQDLKAWDPSPYHNQIKGRVHRRTWGCSVKERRNGVILKKDAGLGSYSPPSGYAKSDLLVAS